MIGPGTTAVVTGGSSGIGAATATELARRGAGVVVVGRDGRALGDVAVPLGGRVCVADLAEPEAADRVAGEAGDVDLLVCNAGVGWAGRFAEMPPEDIDRLVRVNLLSVLHLVRAVLPGMLRRGHGHVVLVSSIAGCMGVAEEAAYSASKAGLHVLAGSLRHEVAGRGVGVTVVFPGVVDTAFFDRRGAPYPRRRPRPVPAERVARALVAGVERRRAEVFVPGWLRLPARLRGLAPGPVDALQRHFG
ncbi:SDR family NAD(P)-dependent oxidoreductase [Prauserella shujinwangii]|uniref:SDR family NAD(P)-dependent oxidoreductase n=1 Tax=Prauserella shujinwangii TaxID=1453103 RepID=UPI000D053BF9|nr:SDR family NAD(P)-dependent oxidoreductase [Prauserella shujinwangii]